MERWLRKKRLVVEVTAVTSLDIQGVAATLDAMKTAEAQAVVVEGLGI